MRTYLTAITIMVSSICYCQNQPVNEKDSLQPSILINELDEVIVTATRTRRKAENLPMPVKIIGKNQLKKTGVSRLDEILNEQTGLVTTTDQSGFQGLQMQGISSQYIMILIDGVPVVGRNSGNLDLSRLAVGNIEQVEIVKGPSSSLYGSEALGGVINIITKKPSSEKIGGDVNYTFGTFNTHESNVNLFQKKKDFGYTLFLNSLISDGYDLDKNLEGNTVDAHQNFTVGSNLSYDFSDNLKAGLKNRFYYQNTDVSGSSEESDLNIQAQLEHKINPKINLTYEGYFTNYQANQLDIDPINDEVLFESDFNQTLIRPEVRAEYNLSADKSVVGGAGITAESLDRNLFPDRVTFDSQYAYGQLSFKPVRDLEVIAGGRFDNHSEYASQFSPKIAALFKINKKLSLKASVGSGFKAPDFRQLYLDFTNSAVGYTVAGKRVEQQVLERLQNNNEILSLTVDPSELGDDLEAESSVGYNFGFDYKGRTYNFKFNAFRNDFEDLIDTRIIARKTNGQNVFGYINRHEVYTTGIETDLSLEIFENLNLSLGYQLLYAKDKAQKRAVDNGEVFARDPKTLETVRLQQSDYFGLPNQSRHLANAKLFYNIPLWQADVNVRVNYRSKYALFDTNGNGLIDKYDDSYVDGFATTNVTAGKWFGRKYYFQLIVKNIFDNEQTGLLNAPGIQISGRIQYNF